MKNAAKTITRFSVCLALILALNYLESLVFALIPLPIPGCKLGVSNAVLLYLIGRREIKSAYLLAILRSLFHFLLFGGALGAAFSLCGGLFSVTAMALTSSLTDRGYSFISISLFGSVCFQIGQMLPAVILYDFGVLYLLPWLLLAGLIAGGVLGILQNLLFERIKTADQSA